MEKLTVFYDGSCPVCDREICFYKRRRNSESVSWTDVSRAQGAEVAPGLSREQAMARFHVRLPDGSIVSGGYAFAELWAAIPGFRLLGRVFRKQPLAWLLDRAYDFFLKVRPTMQRIVPPR